MHRQATACKNGVPKVTRKQLDADFVLQCAPGMNSKILLLGPACCVGQLKVSSNCAMVSHTGQWSSVWMGAGLRCRTISATEARLEGSVVCESMAATGMDHVSSKSGKHARQTCAANNTHRMLTHRQDCSCLLERVLAVSNDGALRPG